MLIVIMLGLAVVLAPAGSRLPAERPISGSAAGPADPPPAAGPAPPPADAFVYPIAGGRSRTHCRDGDGWYVSREYLTAERCGQAADDLDTHLGEDWNGEGGGDSDLGREIAAIGSGIVEYAAVPGPCWGPVVIIHHLAPDQAPFRLPDGREAREVWSLYAHFQRVDVTAGDRVSAGQRLGLLGNDCCGCYAHLHFEVISDPAGPFPGGGYYAPSYCAAPPCGRVDPSEFLDLNR